MDREKLTPSTVILKSIIIILYTINVTIFLLFFLNRTDVISSDFFIFHMDFANFWFRSFLALTVIALWDIIISKKYITNEKQRELSVILLLTTTFLDSMGNLFGWYTINNPYSISWYDKLIHFINPMLGTFFFYIILHNQYQKYSRSLLAITAVGLTTLFSVIYEIHEYVNDQTTGTQMIGGTEDIIFDLTADVFGALIALIILIFLLAKRK